MVPHSSRLPNTIFQCFLKTKQNLLLFFTLAFLLGRSLHLSLEAGAPCCWQPLEDAPRALGQQWSRLAEVKADPPHPSPGAALFSPAALAPTPSHTCRLILHCLRLPEANFALLQWVASQGRTFPIALNLCRARGEQEVIFQSKTPKALERASAQPPCLPETAVRHKEEGHHRRRRLHLSFSARYRMKAGLQVPQQTPRTLGVPPLWWLVTMA